MALTGAMTGARPALRCSAVVVALLGAGAAGLAEATPAGASGPRGSYTVTLDWAGLPPTVETLTLGARHHFVFTDGASGTYSYRARSKALAMTVTSNIGCPSDPTGPVYYAKGTPTTGFSGSMACPSGTPSGTWSTGPVS
ncbi:MAG TPA: hypothetical protein VKG43_12220 [Acidimicrobiales bacterium]|nr:hypothetical protein [Acidimicrobiales bacterium]